MDVRRPAVAGTFYPAEPAALRGAVDLLLAGVASRSRYPQVEPAFDDAIRSFAPVDAAEAGRIKPNRVGFATVRAGDTWQGIAERTGGLIPAGDLAVLNGFAANETPPAGQRIKIVIAGQ